MQDWQTWVTIVLIVAGVIIVGGIIYFIVRHYQNKNKK